MASASASAGAGEKRKSAATPKPEDYTTVKSAGPGLSSAAQLTKEGRIQFSLKLRKKLPELPTRTDTVREFAVDPSFADGAQGVREGGKVPCLSIVIMIVGSRGDVQPYLALGKELARHGHRVRIATHGTFRSFVTDTGLEFFDIGGDPAELMSYMVRNPGLMPGWASLTNGDIGRKRKTMAKILDGCWKSCFHPDGAKGTPFAADAIIANPPSFAHVHCAEALGIPLLMSFTMPWTATTGFPHPLVNVSKTNAEPGLTNYFSYAVAELLTWQGLGDLINKFRERHLRLEPLSPWAGAGLLDRLKVPWTYCFSPEIVPKPEDWTNHIDVVGFYFLDLASGYVPPPDLVAFLQAGPPPVYIGFGSVVVDNPDELTETIFEATRLAGVRALVSPGWGGIGGADIPEHVFILPNVPHDWLFKHVAAVCHHGGAGTMAIGLRLGKPTIIVPFFGDQPFWGTMVHRAGAGPEPIRTEDMSVQRLADSIRFCLTPQAQRAAEEMGAKIRASSGVDAGVRSFHQHLPVLNMRCDLCPERLAVWWSTKHCLKLSAYAAQVLSDTSIVKLKDLDLHRPKEYASRPEYSNPVSGGLMEVFRLAVDAQTSLMRIFHSPVKGIVNTTIAIPRGVVMLLDGVNEGLRNAPTLWGTKVHTPGKVTDWKSGMVEGGKEFYYGFRNGIGGLVTEPYKGAKKEGWLGFVKGSAASYVNATIQPFAGIFGVVSKPMHGAWLSLLSINDGPSLEDQMRSMRTKQGLEEFNAASTRERSVIVDKFRLASTKERTKERRKAMEALIRAALTDGALQTGGLPHVPADAGSSFAYTSLESSSSLASGSEQPLLRRVPPLAHPSSSSRDSGSSSWYSHENSVDSLPTPPLHRVPPPPSPRSSGSLDPQWPPVNTARAPAPVVMQAHGPAPWHAHERGPNPELVPPPIPRRHPSPGPSTHSQPGWLTTHKVSRSPQSSINPLPTEASGSSTASVWTVDDEAQFEKELEEARLRSMEDSVTRPGKEADARFEHDMELAMEISRGEQQRLFYALEAWAEHGEEALPKYEA